MAERVDFIQVGRVAHELSERHGARAHQHAASLAGQAEAEGDEEACRFWKAIEAALKPR